MSVKVAIDISPTETGHATRGIGVYTKNLIWAMEQEISKGGEQEFEISGVDLSGKQFNNLAIEQFNLVHYPYFDLFYLTLPLRKSVKTIVTIHDVTPLVFPDHYPPGIRGTIKFTIQKFSLRGASAVITDSLFSKKDIVKYLGYPEEQIYVVYLAQNAIFRPLNLSESEAQITRKKYGLPARFILYVGGINYNKNIPILIKACEKVKIPLVIVGKEAIQKDIDRTHLENKDLVWVQDYYKNQQTKDMQLLLVGFVPDEELVKIYNLATVYCQPSFYEGFGLPVLEAMACGCPVVTSNTSSLPEICSEVAVMVEPNDYHSIASGLEKVMRDKKTRDTLIKEGLEQVKKFSWEKTARETIYVYKKVIKV